MNHRRFASATMAAVISMVGLMPVLLAGQQGDTSKGASGTLRTPWGEPDLQGIWTNETITPLERPDQYAGREFLTDEEVAALEKRRLERLQANPGRTARIYERGSERDVAGAYNNVFLQQPDDPGAARTGRRTSQIIDPPDGKLPPVTPEAQQRLAARVEYLNALLQGTSGGRPGPPSPRRAEPPPLYNVDRMNRSDGPEDRSVSERCLGGSLPSLGGYFRIVQSPGYVAIYFEQGDNRVIPITDRPPLPGRVRQWLGDARGRWDGDTLVVETTNFTHKTEYRGAREHLHLVERYRRVDAHTIDYQVTISDPTTWTRPWTLTVPFARQDDRANLIFEATCHEGNFGLTGMLSNTRAAERLFAEGRGPDPATQDIATGGMGSALPEGVGRAAIEDRTAPPNPASRR